ncbi:helix-turn-helix domain-containing protein [Myxococcus sp. NMCA1]|uniref:helix-turn-helix domain-containing protein n=1 Tax=Myxococcus sp. NMCA1 TaxID=2996785 RepID=UPI002285BFEE|nr:helix-turn-helix domain-containing protein [Myxococcus sp. NMCA1]WAM28502.1 helix-turn-helix domain-containing protein [Myxococcus sp. NMCA1]
MADVLEGLRRIIREELRGTPMQDELLSPAEAAVVAGYSVSSIQGWLREGKLTRYGTPRRTRVSRRELLALLTKQPEAPLSDADIDAKAQRLLRRKAC